MNTLIGVVDVVGDAARCSDAGRPGRPVADLAVQIAGDLATGRQGIVFVLLYKCLIWYGKTNENRWRAIYGAVASQWIRRGGRRRCHDNQQPLRFWKIDIGRLRAFFQLRLLDCWMWIPERVPRIPQIGHWSLFLLGRPEKTRPGWLIGIAGSPKEIEFISQLQMSRSFKLSVKRKIIANLTNQFQLFTWFNNCQIWRRGGQNDLRNMWTVPWTFFGLCYFAVMLKLGVCGDLWHPQGVRRGIKLGNPSSMAI